MLTRKGALRVPQITVAFWVVKGLSTAFGEATSDYLVHAISPAGAVLIGFAAFVGALALQLRMARYLAWTYWLAVAMVGTFGTMAADVLHVGFHVSYTASTVFYAIVLAAVFIVWNRTEGTLSIHSIDTLRRELFYWTAVASTFAMGTALGDFTANTLKLGYLPSAVVFVVLIAVPAIAYAATRRNAVLYFWAAYVVTRPLGASVADGLGKAKNLSGLGWGDGLVAALFGAAIIVAVAFLAITGADIQTPAIP